MAEENNEVWRPALGDDDVASLLKYNGPSLCQEEPIAEGVELVDFRNSDRNEQNVSKLLSAKGIKFNLQRPRLGWADAQIRLILTVPISRADEAMKVLGTAAKAGLVETVPGTEGMISY
jgi:hypothetical protein